MATKTRVAYVGDNFEFSQRLQAICAEHCWDMSSHNHPADFIQHLLQDGFPSDAPTSTAKFQWINKHLAPVVLELDFQLPESIEVVREIKMIHGAIPVIVIGRNESLSSIAVTRLDDAEAFFHGPLQDLTSLTEAIQSSFDRLAHWQDILQQCREATSVLNTTIPVGV